MSLLNIHGLSKRYHEGEQTRSVFEQLDLAIARGEVVALLGSSGAGKSTLLNLISGIDRPDEGAIVIDGLDIVALNETERTRWRRQHLGFVFQFFNLIPTLTVAENIRLPLQLNGIDDGRHRQRAAELLARVGLQDRNRSFPERLSGGEQQRLAVVRALIHRPLLLLADEPTGNLDSASGQRVIDLLLELAGAHQTTVLMVTHSRAVAAHADRVLRLVGGALESVAP